MPARANVYNPAKRLTAARLGALVVLLLFAVTLPASARYNEQVTGTNPGDRGPNPWQQDLYEGVGIAERLNSPVPLDLTLTDENGNPVEFASFFVEGRPVILNLGYSRCPSICIMMRNQLASVMGDMDREMGEDFIVLNISIDPQETPADSRAMRDQVFAQLREQGVEPDPEGWRFLTANQDTITQLTDAVGYRYIYIELQNEYGHPGVLVLIDSSGTVRRYLRGDLYTANTLDLSLVETEQGENGSIWDQVFLTCFEYDAEAGNYTATWMFIMMSGGAVTLLFVGGLVVVGFAYERRRRQMLGEENNNGPTAGEAQPA